VSAIHRRRRTACVASVTAVVNDVHFNMCHFKGFFMQTENASQFCCCSCHRNEEINLPFCIHMLVSVCVFCRCCWLLFVLGRYCITVRFLVIDVQSISFVEVGDQCIFCTCQLASIELYLFAL